MENAWDIARRQAEKYSGAGGRYFRLANHGDKGVVAFCGNPTGREVVWTGEKYVPFDAKEHGAGKATFRVAVNVYVPEERAMKIFEGSVVWFRELLEIREKYTLSTKLFEIKRHGRARDTKTKYSILPDVDISPALRKEIDATPLHDIEEVLSEDQDVEDDIDRSGPIADAAARDIAARLKELPRAAIEPFLAEFHIAKIRDLHASDEAPALAWIAKYGASSVVDPFA